MHVSYHYLIFNYKIVPRDPRKKLQILQIYNETGLYYENIISLLKFIIKLLILEIEFNLIIYIHYTHTLYGFHVSLWHSTDWWFNGCHVYWKSHFTFLDFETNYLNVKVFLVAKMAKYHHFQKFVVKKHRFKTI